MPKQASKLFFSIFFLISFFVNYVAPAASPEASPESVPVLPKSEVPSSNSEAVSSISLPPSVNFPGLETSSDNVSSLEDPSVTVPNVEDYANETSKGDLETLSSPLAPSNVVASVLDTTEDEKPPQEMASLPPTSVDNAAALENTTIEDLFQESTSLPPSSVADSSILQTNEDDTSFVSPAPVIIEAPAFEAKDDGSISADDASPALETSENGSFSQENQSPTPETISDPLISNEIVSSPSPSYTETQNPSNLNVPDLNDYSSIPKAAAPAPSVEEPPYPVSDTETTQTAPSAQSEDDDLAPSSHPSILPFNYRAEDEPVEPYEEEEDSWDGFNSAVAGVLLGVCVVGVGGFVYQKRKNENKVQYECLAKRGGV